MKRERKAKKTKSRNGCGRCKLKRLKCDETVPGCLQCKRRNAACPGYEKTLKWSTKYEVFTPLQGKFSSSRQSSSPEVTTQQSLCEPSLPKTVASGMEALAAVLPACRKPSVVQLESTPIVASPPALDEAMSAQETSTDDNESPRDLEPLLTENLDVFDPISLDVLVDAVPLPHHDLDLDTLDTFEHIDFDPILQEERSLDPNITMAQDVSVVSLPLPALAPCQDPSPRISRSLLLDFYRLPNPSPNPEPLDDMESLLVQHYFKDTCAVFSSFDSVLNPFRTTIGRIYRDTPSINYAIQSMAAAHLANTFPNMAAVGAELQRKAHDALEIEMPLAQSGQASATKTFLSIMMLGLTTSWHDSTALGTEYLSTARSLILPKLLSRSEEAEVQREAQFFEESLLHWEMLMGFVTEDAMTFSPSPELRPRIVAKKNSPAGRRSDGRIVPHPWTGIAPMVQFLFAEVGRLVRRERAMNRNSTLDLRRQQENITNAASLEESLLAVEYPTVDEVADTGDERTPKDDFVVLAEAYRCAGLLELYRVFPSILCKRLGSGKFNRVENASFLLPMPRYKTPYEDTDVKLWLNSLAMHTLNSLKSIPSSSGTFCVQPLLLVVAASELRFVSSVDFFDVDANDSKILTARDFAIRRLQEFALRLPNKPLRQMIQLIKETWRQSDDGKNAFWIDIMNERGWHCLM